MSSFSPNNIHIEGTRVGTWTNLLMELEIEWRGNCGGGVGWNGGSRTRAGPEDPRMSFARSGLNAMCSQQCKDICFLTVSGASHSVLHQELLYYP